MSQRNMDYFRRDITVLQSIEIAFRTDVTVSQSIEMAVLLDITVSQTIEIALGEICFCHSL